MKCPKCGGVTFVDVDGDRYSVCGWREPLVPFPDALEGGNRPPTHAHKTINAATKRYEDAKLRGIMRTLRRS